MQVSERYLPQRTERACPQVINEIHVVSVCFQAGKVKEVIDSAAWRADQSPVGDAVAGKGSAGMKHSGQSSG